MPKHRLKLTQVYRVEKWIMIDVEAATLDDAIETVTSDDAPCSSLPGWEDHWDLQNEEVSPA